MSQLNNNEKWYALQEYLKKKEVDLVAQIKINSKRGAYESFASLGSQLAIISDILKHAESLDQDQADKPDRGRVTPPKHSY